MDGFELKKLAIGGTSKMGGIIHSYKHLVQLFGVPYINNGQGGYPDDSDKTDICWHLQNKETGAKIMIWNYKNGPVYCPDVKSFDEIDVFSFWANENGLGYLLLKGLIERVDCNLQRKD